LAAVDCHRKCGGEPPHSKLLSVITVSEDVALGLQITPGMRTWLTLAWCIVSVGGHSVGERLVERVYVDASGSVHVVETGGHDKAVPKEKDQVGSSAVKIADDKKTVAWLAEYDNCCTSYPIPLALVVYRNGRVLQRLGDGLMIYDWRFWASGEQIAFCSGTVHGDSGGHCELHDVRSGRILQTIDGHLDDRAPEWAKGLEN
jgi:hypothetical protein